MKSEECILDASWTILACPRPLPCCPSCSKPEPRGSAPRLLRAVAVRCRPLPTHASLSGPTMTLASPC